MIGKPWIALAHGYKPYQLTKLDQYLLKTPFYWFINKKIKIYFWWQTRRLTKQSNHETN